ncbi:LPS export ABC transporter ATP-binding protein [Caminibacter pacificus]|uniref:LPS export ABC transporter ATP-binding protein n=1 Tax=Caminibacter pacificus TaxID=1424653 RepID=A0AAJ4UYI6_9BACT|nr:LPS export ABC transporter ATP-binding protein [Caminibacter pacificus]QCI28271.1 LPS export ABC transporter ATP-binding protein [Caminibacter pacificus]ROR41015.1 lipopolysaccharide export system ATP-binding protein [Caminibacter pacificus]
MSKLKAENLKKSFKKTLIIKGVSIEVNTGEVVGLLGPNGAGKTTTFYLICGLLEPDEGKVTLEEQDITKYPLHKKARMGIGYLPQESSVFRDLSVEDNLYIVAEQYYDKDTQKKVVEDLLEKFNIEPIRKRKGINLSGGERRRVEIARALVPRPKFLFLDEPFAGVDPVNVNDIKELVKFLSQENIGVIITDHNVRETLSICNRAYVLKDGNILTHGDANHIVNHPEVKKHYLGEEFRL